MRTALPEEGRHAVLFQDYKSDVLSLRYIFIFFLRRYIMILVLVTLRNYILVQIYFHVFGTMYVVGYIGHVQPFLDKFANRQEIINELMVWSSAYTLLCFTDFVWDPDMRINIGWCLIGYILLNVIFNIVCLIYQACKQLKFKCKVMKTKWKIGQIKKEHKKRLAEKKEQEAQKVVDVEKEKKDKIDRDNFIFSLFVQPGDKPAEAPKKIEVKTKPTPVDPYANIAPDGGLIEMKPVMAGLAGGNQIHNNSESKEAIVDQLLSISNTSMIDAEYYEDSFRRKLGK